MTDSAHWAPWRRMFAFDHWANGRLLDAVVALDIQLDCEQTTERDPEYAAAREVLREIGHVYFAHDVWHQRMTRGAFAGGGEPFEAIPLDEARQRRQRWGEQWRRFIEAQEAADRRPAEVPVTFTQAGGAELTLPMDEVLRHLFNHGAHHRGKGSAALRRAGHAPPNVDYMRHVREQRGLPLPSA